MHNYVNIDVAENVAYAYWRIALHNDWIVAHGYKPDREQNELFYKLKRVLKVGARELRRITDKTCACKDFDEFYQKLCNLKRKQNEP